ncbi:50S ribosomal protein L13 [candidate division Kazan bacterium RIFCSPHIGHO2_01_FULL_49_10]|uniref:Large ribosomal subunit protein uL13 n=1 Tax=candidate division Kazan bacterium RIFCSPLOWO2_01_FULL_48_13 TaxID=1798539 RepID=A0A1F4PRF8_UNCK3|nr:MAG: 50S ribosomal protein L13 [candidate division Kazan bacterium RIFCSPHIGHO2_01_FULL_49_10]OGB85632.1 MAG: 50S ribosomal protein L13 [candidate division Kazan bacterium RIFCSPLOWO2_01_FULL_48_13]
MKKTTRRPLPAEIKEIWHLIDAQGLVLGRLATRVASILMGKTVPSFDPAITPKTKVVVINANDIKVTGRKLEQKEYIRYTGYPGGIRRKPLARVMAEKSPEALRHAVYGMLPKNRLRKGRMDNLKIYAGGDHPHQAQNPIKLEL